MTRRLLIWDLDGTLVDSRPVMIAAFRAAHAKVGLGEDPPIEGFLSRLGDSFENILAELSLPAEMAEPFRTESRRRLGELRLHDDAVAVLLKQGLSGDVNALLTGKDELRTLEILEYFGIRHAFAVTVTSSTGIAAKPRPDGVLHICRELGADPSTAIVIGDSGYDMRAASAAGSLALGCLWGIGSDTELAAGGAAAVFATPRELAEFLRSRPGGWPDDVVTVTMRDPGGDNAA